MLYARTEDGTIRPAADAAELRVHLSSGGAVSADGRVFAELPIAMASDGRVRDALGGLFPTPSLRGVGSARLVALVLAAPPLAVLLLRGGHAPELATTALLVAYIAWELTRRTPRFPRVAAVALVAVAARFGLDLAAACGHAAFIVALSFALAAADAAFVLARIPTAGRLGRELFAKIDVTPGAAPQERGFVRALGIAGAFVALGIALRRLGVGIQVGAALAYGFAAPFAMPHAPRRSVRSVARGIFAGLTLAEAATGAAATFFAIGTDVARCAKKLDASSLRAELQDAQRIADSLAHARGSSVLWLAAIALGVAEERVFRGVLQRALAARYGVVYGVVATSATFAFTHTEIYAVPPYQLFLLGAGVGLAYAEGGIVAAIATRVAFDVLALA